MSDTTRYVLFDLETRDVKGIVRNKPTLGENYFEVEYNVDDGIYFLSNINFNKTENTQMVFYEINNIQQLNNLISKEFKKINLD